MLSPIDAQLITKILAARGAHRPRFSPDGKTLYYCSDREGTVQLYRMSLPAGKSERVSRDADRIGAYRLSSDGRRIAYAADAGGNERWELYVADADGSGARALTGAPALIHHLVGWMPSGQEVALFSNARDGRYFDLQLASPGGAARTVLAHDGTGGSATILPDGRLVARFDRDRGDRNHLVLAEPEGARQVTPDDPPAMYAHAHPYRGGLLVRSDRGGEFVGVATLGLDGAYSPIVNVPHDVEELDVAGDRWTYAVNVDGESEVHVVDERGDRVIGGLPPGALVGDQFGDSLAIADDGTVAIAWARYASPPAIHVARPGRDAEIAVAPQSEVPAASLPRAEHVAWPTFDGRTIPGYLLRPANAPSGSRPTVVQVHGGPEGQARPLWNPLTVAFVAAGFNVLQPNVRGSRGYGRAYMSLDDVQLRFDSVKDMDAGAAWLVDSGVAPKDGIGLIGGSYGGFMTLAGITFFPDRWAAAVDIVGVANFITFFERTSPWRRPLRAVEYGDPVKDKDFLTWISPINHLEAIKAPLMVIHGANDPRVPVEEAEQIVAAQRSRGREVEYLRYEDEGHGLAKAKNRADAWPKVVAFFERHLLR